jgi:small-conductance mechanosensitive channel
VAISSAGIPLAVFALFGGALAIAAGIGSQKILNNFLSGIILLIERSIQVGDMIEVDKTQGLVKRIGLRNVHIKTFSNVDMLVPNSKFLEENVINWTLESDIIKAHISVKVGFDVDYNEVINLLTETAINHPKVLPAQNPKAFLEEFNADNGYLLFKLYYWLRVPNPEEKLSIESDLRIGILNCLYEHGIALASPTLGVSLTTEQVTTSSEFKNT